MPNVNVERAKQLVRASALAYETSIHSSWKRIGDGKDSVIVRQDDFGVIVAFRGTVIPTEPDPMKAIDAWLDWWNDIDLVLKDVPYSAGKVHDGFRKSLEILWDDLLVEVESAAQGGRRVFFTGHSKGGALATLAARRFKGAGVVPAGVMTFGAPRVGDEKFARAYDVEVPNHWRFEHQDDIVPHFPPYPAFMEVLRAAAILAQVSTVSEVVSILAGSNFSTSVPFGEISERLAKQVTQPFGHYEHVGTLCFLNWNDKLDEDNSATLARDREVHLIKAGTELITDHFIDKRFRLDGKLGYVETVNNI